MIGNCGAIPYLKTVTNIKRKSSKISQKTNTWQQI